MNKPAIWVVAASLALGGAMLGQSASGQKPEPPAPAENQAPPRSDTSNNGDFSSSKNSRIDLSAPKGDALSHPQSQIPSDATEFKPYDPHRAEKNVEVGDYYYKQKNYRAAQSRYREALEYKPNDAAATIKLASALEKLGQVADARQSYEDYLRILPNGPSSQEAKQALDRLPKLENKKASIEELKDKSQ